MSDQVKSLQKILFELLYWLCEIFCMLQGRNSIGVHVIKRFQFTESKYLVLFLLN